MNNLKLRFFKFLSNKLQSWKDKIDIIINRNTIKTYSLGNTEDCIEIIKGEKPYTIQVKRDKNTGEILQTSVINQ